jgi:hypothetical protein
VANSGIGSQWGFKKESVWGTAVTVDKFFEYNSETFNLDQTYYDGVGLRAGRTFGPQSRTKKTTRGVNGAVSLEMPYKLSGALFDQMVAGTITPVQQAASIAYLSTFNVGASVPNKSATNQFNKPASSSAGDTAFTYPGSVLTAASFSMATGGTLTGQHDVDGRRMRRRRRRRRRAPRSRPPPTPRTTTSGRISRHGPDSTAARRSAA